MTCLAVFLLTLLLKYLMSSEGVLSPPVNLSVDSLDFRTSVRWLPGKGSPTGTRYSVEFIDIIHFSELVWNRTANCTNMTSTQCYLYLDHHMSNYFMRVMAEWKDERSKWTMLTHAFQPYSTTRLSAPTLHISHDHCSIRINLKHPVQSLMRLQFSVDLFFMTPDLSAKDVAHMEIMDSYCFKDLPSGNYCFSASAFHTHMTKNMNFNATKCVLLSRIPREGISYIIGLGVLLLLFILAGIVLSLMCCYMNPQIKNIKNIPKPLRVTEGTAKGLMLNLEKPHSNLLFVQSEDNKIAYERMYFARESYKHGSISDLESVKKPFKRDLYSLAVEMEEDSRSPTQEETLSTCCSIQGNPHPESVYSCSLSMTAVNEPPVELEVENLLHTCAPMNAEDNWTMMEDTESDEEDVDKMSSEYEPRPDPCLYNSEAQ